MPEKAAGNSYNDTEQNDIRTYLLKANKYPELWRHTLLCVRKQDSVASNVTSTFRNICPHRQPAMLLRHQTQSGYVNICSGTGCCNLSTLAAA